MSNAHEAKSLFRHPLLRAPDAPVLLEAFHYRFHPSWQFFLTLFEAADVEHVEVLNSLFRGVFGVDDIRFNYALAGGSLMDFGTYAVSTMRGVFGREPLRVVDARYRGLPAGCDDKCDEAMFASYEFSEGATADISIDSRAHGGYTWFPWLTAQWPSFKNALPTIKVRLRAGEEESVEEGRLVKRVLRILRKCNSTMSFFFVLRDGGGVIEDRLTDG